MKHVNLSIAEQILYNFIDTCVLVISATAFTWGFVTGKISPPQKSSIVYYLIVAAVLFLFVTDIIKGKKNTSSVKGLICPAKYPKDILHSRLLYGLIFLAAAILILAFRHDALQLCTLLLAGSVYYSLDSRILLAMKAPGFYENGILFYGTLIPYEKIEKYEYNEETGILKIESKAERVGLYGGETVLIPEDKEKAKEALKNVEIEKTDDNNND